MINNRFGLREEPFRITPTARFTYASQEHEEAFNGFVLAVLARRRLMALYGETGSGKTSLLQELLDHMEGEGTMVLAVAARPGMTVEDLIQEAGGELLHDETNGQPLTDMDALVERLEQRLEEAGTGVLIVDEAHELDLPVLYDLVDMASSDTETGRFLQVLLAGAPDLERMLAEPGLDDAMRRLGVSYHLPPLDQEQIGTYIQQRLRQAGSDRDDIFEPAAVQAIAQYSGGLLQLVNTLGDVALSGAMRNGERTVTRARIDQVRRPDLWAFSRCRTISCAHRIRSLRRCGSRWLACGRRRRRFRRLRRLCRPWLRRVSRHMNPVSALFSRRHISRSMNRNLTAGTRRSSRLPLVAQRHSDRPEVRPLNTGVYSGVRPGPAVSGESGFWPAAPLAAGRRLRRRLAGRGGRRHDHDASGHG